MTIDEARNHIGHAVTYRPRGNPDARAEDGVITAVGHLYVFVRYGAARTSQATNPADLTLLAGKVPGDG